VSAVAAGSVRLSERGMRRLERGHPWIFADDVEAADAAPGALVAIEGRGRVVGFGLFSSQSKIRVRLVTRGGREPGADLWRVRLARAIDARRRLGLYDPRGACRLLGGDAEGVPGLVVDHYAGVCVLQSGTQGSDAIVAEIARLLGELSPDAPRAIVDRSDASVRRLEGLEPRVAVLCGELPEPLEVREPGLTYEVDVLHGHKTGHYLDQRANRVRAAELARGGDVLDLFSYDGLFGVRAALAGARRVVCVDQSGPALARARRNAERNGVADRVACERAGALDDLRERVARGERFRLVVVDPPAFARSKREVEGAERGYRELNARAMRAIEPGGYLVSASCSHALSAARFVELLAQAAHGARRDAYIEELRGASPDHPALLTLPESAYLKCAFVRIEGGAAA
jgi:23S rRNA (cytosine1962-C5)-methyltransferase